MEGSTNQTDHRRRKRVKHKTSSIESQPKSDVTKVTKLEHKLKFKEYMKQMKEAWSSISGEEMDDDLGVTVPDGLKKYTIKDRKIILQKSMCQKLEIPGESYDGPKDAKQVDLANEGEEPQLVWIATNLSPDEEKLLIHTLRDHRNVFAWSYKDLKGVAPNICQHTIPMREDAKPSKQRPYTYNENFANKIKEEINKLLEVEFIYEIDNTEWVSPIVVVPKKNGKLIVCINLKSMRQPFVIIILCQ